MGRMGGDVRLPLASFPSVSALLSSQPWMRPLGRSYYHLSGLRSLSQPALPPAHHCAPPGWRLLEAPWSRAAPSPGPPPSLRGVWSQRGAQSQFWPELPRVQSSGRHHRHACPAGLKQQLAVSNGYDTSFLLLTNGAVSCSSVLSQHCRFNSGKWVLNNPQLTGATPKGASPALQGVAGTIPRC